MNLVGSRRSARTRVVMSRVPSLVLGLVLVGTGIGLNVKADLGLPPWNVFHQGLARRTPLSIGLATILVGGMVLLAWIPLKERIGIGTVFNAVLVGATIDATMFVVDDTEVLLVRWIYLVVGIGLVGFGSGLYIGARLGPGPRDGVMTGLAKLGLSVRVARFLLEGTALSAGWLLGGTVEIGTLAFTVLIGPLVQFFLRLFDRGPIAMSGSGQPGSRSVA